MPIFEYICNQCKRPFEALVMGSQTAACPNCGSGDLEQKFSAYSVGAGWRGAQWSGTGSCGASGAT
jgi:putative FmdB family regulatory protein